MNNDHVAEPFRTILNTVMRTQNKTTHTPGPWDVEITDDFNWIGPMRSDGVKVSEVVCHIDRENLKPEALDKADANARLIPAAPELLEVLQVFSTHYSNGAAGIDEAGRHGLDAILFDARIVIAKAKQP